VNAQLTNTLDFDDTLVEVGPGHPGATVIPAAMALAEREGASGKTLITAVILGYDAYSRIAVAGKPSFERSKQVRGMATWQVHGAAAAAARILELDAEAIARALGLAALHAPVSFVGKIYEERPLWSLKNNFGWAAMGGVLGAGFAADGLDANRRILEGETGFWAMAGSDRWDPEALVAGLGTDHRILKTSFKPYPCCRFTHSTLDALSDIVISRAIRAEDVARVAIHSSSKIQKFAQYAPASVIDAQFSLPYLVAMVMLRVPPGYGWAEIGRWEKPAVENLSKRVDLVVDPAAESDLMRGHMKSRVVVEMEDGRTEEAEATYARGDPNNPLSDRQLQTKFLDLATPLIGSRKADALHDLLGRLEEVKDISEVTSYLKDVRSVPGVTYAVDAVAGSGRVDATLR
jgi:2-methylcitrate dehydratase PrpD